MPFFVCLFAFYFLLVIFPRGHALRHVCVRACVRHSSCACGMPSLKCALSLRTSTSPRSLIVHTFFLSFSFSFAAISCHVQSHFLTHTQVALSSPRFPQARALCNVPGDQDAHTFFTGTCNLQNDNEVGRCVKKTLTMLDCSSLALLTTCRKHTLS